MKKLTKDHREVVAAKYPQIQHEGLHKPRPVLDALSVRRLQDFLDKLNHMAALEGARFRIRSKSDGLLECRSFGIFQHPGCISLQEAPQVETLAPLSHARAQAYFLMVLERIRFLGLSGLAA